MPCTEKPRTSKWKQYSIKCNNDSFFKKEEHMNYFTKNIILPAVKILFTTLSGWWLFRGGDSGNFKKKKFHSWPFFKHIFFNNNSTNKYSSSDSFMFKPCQVTSLASLAGAQKLQISSSLKLIQSKHISDWLCMCNLNVSILHQLSKGSCVRKSLRIHIPEILFPSKNINTD